MITENEGLNPRGKTLMKTSKTVIGGYFAARVPEGRECWWITPERARRGGELKVVKGT